MPILLLFLVGMICAAFSATLAETKGYNQINWAGAGFFFGPLALLVAMGLPDRKLRSYIFLLAKHQGALEEGAPAPWGEDADAQRRRIRGVK